MSAKPSPRDLSPMTPKPRVIRSADRSLAWISRVVRVDREEPEPCPASGA